MIGLDGGGDGEPLDRRQATNAARRNLKIANVSGHEELESQFICK